MNLMMQLRKVAGHPYLFDGVEDRELDPMGDHVITVRETIGRERRVLMSRIVVRWFFWTSYSNG